MKTEQEENIVNLSFKMIIVLYEKYMENITMENVIVGGLVLIMLAVVVFGWWTSRGDDDKGDDK